MLSTMQPQPHGHRTAQAHNPSAISSHRTCNSCALCFTHARTGLGVCNLTVQIAHVDYVGVYDAQPADTSCSQKQHNGTAQATSAHNKHAAAAQTLLLRDTELW